MSRRYHPYYSPNWRPDAGAALIFFFGLMMGAIILGSMMMFSLGYKIDAVIQWYILGPCSLRETLSMAERADSAITSRIAWVLASVPILAFLNLMWRANKEKV
jgi:ABC-type cobalt transport system substrate-binding protein